MVQTSNIITKMFNFTNIFVSSFASTLVIDKMHLPFFAALSTGVVVFSLTYLSVIIFKEGIKNMFVMDEEPHSVYIERVDESTIPSNLDYDQD